MLFFTLAAFFRALALHSAELYYAQHLDFGTQNTIIRFNHITYCINCNLLYWDILYK